IVICESADEKRSKAADDSLIRSLPAMPFAIIKTVSLVDISPSTVIILKDSSTALLSALSSAERSMLASVIIKQSIVAISGHIIPAPLHMPEIVKKEPFTFIFLLTILG